MEQKAPTNGPNSAAAKHRKPMDRNDKSRIKKFSHAISNVESEVENVVPKQTLIADPYFHFFFG